VIHCGAHELKSDKGGKLGLYVHRSETLRELASAIPTEFGVVHVLLDSAAPEYLRFFKFADNFSKKKREYAAKMLFDDCDIICNHMHQGLLSYGEQLLGTHNIVAEKHDFFPLVLRGDLPAYLLRGKPNIDEETIELLGMSKRAELYGVREKLTQANILPHGGGYTFRDMLTVTDVFERNGVRYFVADMQNGLSKKIVAHPKDLEYSYRGREVVVRVLELKLGEIVAELVPEYVLKV
jgi:hypothetical protein